MSVITSKLHELYFNQQFGNLKTNNEVKKHFIKGIFPRKNRMCHNVIGKSYNGKLIREISKRIFGVVMKHKMFVNFCEDLLVNSVVATYAKSALSLSERLYNYTIGGMSTNLFARGKFISLSDMEFVMKILESIECEDVNIYPLIRSFLIETIVARIREMSDDFTNIGSELGKYIERLINVFGAINIKDYVFSTIPSDMGFVETIKTVTKHLPLMVTKPKKRKIRTIAICYTWISDCGGIETYIENAIVFLRSLGYDVVLVTTTPKDKIRINTSGVKLEIINRCKVHCGMPLSEIVDFESEMKQVLLRNKVDLFYT